MRKQREGSANSYFKKDCVTNLVSIKLIKKVAIALCENGNREL